MIRGRQVIFKSRFYRNPIYLIYQTLFAAEPAKSFPVEIRNHAWTRFGDSFLIAGGNGVEIGDGITDLDTIYRLQRLSSPCWNPIDPINLQVRAY